MSDKELIQALRPMVLRGKFQCLGCKHEHRCSTHGCAILKHALERLEQLTEPESNNPLTLEELREMDWEPVWVIRGEGEGRWALIRFVNKYGIGTHGCGFLAFEDWQVDWLAYRHRPEEAAP